MWIQHHVSCGVCAGQRSRKVYFPKGADWVHHYSGQKFSGGTTQVRSSMHRALHDS